MDTDAIDTIMSTVESIAASLEVAHDSWRDHPLAIRNITAALELSDNFSAQFHRERQIRLLSVFQRVAYADADSGGINDIGDWCLRQAVTLLQVSPEDVELLTLIGRNWLSRAQRSLARIHLSEQDSISSGEIAMAPLSSSEERRKDMIADREAEIRSHQSDYVEARGILLPAVEYLKRAVESAYAQGKITGELLSTSAEAYMSLGNVSSPKTNRQYFQQALEYLEAAIQLPEYDLPSPLRNYFEEYSNIMGDVE